MTKLLEKIQIFLTKKGFLLERSNLEDYYREIVKDNFLRLSIIATLLFFYECYLYLITDRLFNVGPIVSKFLLVCVGILPLIYYVYLKSDKVNLVFANLVKYFYALSCIVFGISLALFIQDQADYVHMYLLIVFFTAAFLYMHPISSFILIFATYLYFLYLLPSYVSDPSGRFVIISNTAGSNAAAWIMSLIMWRTRVTIWKNKKLLHRQNIQLQEISKKDSMTNLFNHETSLLILEREIDLAKTQNYPLSLIIMDIDDFKNINDTYGHLFGDLVIKEIAEIMRSEARKSDFVGRYGGEEFIIIMPHTDLQEAYAFSDRLHNKIKNSNKPDRVKITLSGGVSEFKGESTNELIRLTDQKLYSAKKSGKNCFKTELNDLANNLSVY